MGSEDSEEKKRVKEKIDAYQYIIDSAYILFDGKYSVHDIETMPYKELLIKIENEQKLNKELNDARKKREEEEAREARRRSQRGDRYY